MSTDNIPPDEAFAQLGNEIRVNIIQVLGEAKGESLTFSELRNQVGTRDSGQFAYHLDRLVGRFLRQTDDGQYELSYSGNQVVGAILSGEFNRREGPRSFTLESICVSCGAPVKARYEDERVKVRCPSCGETLSSFDFPPGGFDGRNIDDITQTFRNWILGILRFTSGGICHICAGKTSGRLTDKDGTIYEEDPVCVEFECRRCNGCSDGVTMSVNAYLLLHPAVIAFHFNHGINVYESDPWNLEFLRDRTIHVLSEDPLRVETILELDSDHLPLVVEEDLSVRTL